MGTRLRNARILAGFTSATTAADALGVSASTYRAHENGQNEFGPEEAAHYGRKFQTTAAYLLTGTGEPLGRDQRKPAGRQSKSDQVPELDTRAGAGGGGIVDLINVSDDHGNQLSAEVVKDFWRMPESFLRGELRVDASKALIVEVSGDSGYDPTNPYAPGSIFPGDRVIVDARDRRPSPPGPFLVYDGTGLVVKLCEPVHGSDPPTIRLLSRNPTYTPYTIALDDGHVIVGRVRGRISAM